jgi:hypothetical protein
MHVRTQTAALKMVKTMAEQRTLKFADLSTTMGEAERLLNSGYQSAEKWNLAQCCGHLNEWLSYPIDRFPKPNLVIAALLKLMKITIG